MIAQRFRALGWVTGIASAATCLYLTSLQVAAERATLEGVETRIAGARRDIRQLQTELGTRASMRQLEKWNGDVLALSAPRADQYLHTESELASVGMREVRLPTGGAPLAPVMLAAATATPEAAPAPIVMASAPVAPPAVKPRLQQVSFVPAPPSTKPVKATVPAKRKTAASPLRIATATVERAPKPKPNSKSTPKPSGAKKPPFAEKPALRQAAAKPKKEATRVAATELSKPKAKPKRAVLTRLALGDIGRAAAAEGRRR